MLWVGLEELNLRPCGSWGHHVDHSATMAPKGLAHRSHLLTLFIPVCRGVHLLSMIPEDGQELWCIFESHTKLAHHTMGRARGVEPQTLRFMGTSC